MRIQHNILAMNAYRNYNTNTSALAKNLEKLSSGYKINRAGDDAAGLAISEKMRAQITGLNAAQKNVKDGISLVKTAEGAMQEIQDMLNRMDYLATQSANGTYDDDVDRLNLQKEVNQLKSEINRIADSANFNGIKLLDGSLNQVDGTAATTKEMTIKGFTFDGMDRMLSNVAGKDEKDWAVAGSKTIFDGDGAVATKGTFKVDLSTLKFYGVASGASNVQSTATFTLTIGNKVITASITGITASMAASAVQSAVFTALASAIGTTVTINGVKWSVSGASTGTITFAQKQVPKTAAEANMNFDVKVSLSATPASKVGADMDFSGLHGTQIVKKAVAQDSAHRASTTFEIKKEDIVDGAQIKLGTTTYTIKLGKNSTVPSTASNIVDLSSLEYGQITDADMNKVITAIGDKIQSVGSTMQFNDADNKTGTFKIGVSRGTSGNSVLGITITKASGSQSKFDTAAEFKDMFSISSKDVTMKVEKPAVPSTGEALTLQIGDTSDEYNQLKVSIGDMHTKGMGIDGIDISSQTGAQAAVQTIKDAINYVSGVRGDLGATQNRLEHTANNLSVMAENIQDAESTIRDTDVAEEMMAYTKNNILIQSAQAMLAQANAVPQGVLQLLG